MTSHAARATIEALDLTSVCTRLMHRQAGLGWSEQRATDAEKGYRAFLLLAKTFPAELLAPTADVDAFWHFHILDTRKYADDCERTFGHYLHHQPDVSVDDSAAAARAALGARTRSLQQSVFGAPAAGNDATWCAVAGAGSETAWCALTPQTANTAARAVTAPHAETAWCALPPQTANTAARAVTAPHTETAWCALTPQSNDAAWCALTPQSNDAAWCALTPQKHTAAQGKMMQTAWCAVATEPRAVDAGRALATHA